MTIDAMDCTVCRVPATVNVSRTNSCVSATVLRIPALRCMTTMTAAMWALVQKAWRAGGRKASGSAVASACR